MNRRLYQALVVALFLTQMGILMGLASPDLSGTDVAVVSDQVHLPVILGTSIVYLLVLLRPIAWPRRFVSGLGTISLLCPLLVYTMVSGLWSTYPSMTMRRSVFFIFSTLIAVILGTEFEVPTLARLFAAASLIHIALCAACMAFAPHYVYSPSDPLALKGLTTHKNVFGLEMGLATLSLGFVPFPWFKNLRLPLTALALVMLLLSRSAGSLVATLAAVAVAPLLLVVRLPGTQRVPIVVGVAAAVSGASYWVVEHASLLPQLLSKDATLTGRTELWSLIVIAIQAHPLLGYGFDSFWQGLQGDSLTIIREVGWLVPTAHNGYLDLLLSTGWVGVLLFFPFCVQTLIRWLRYAGDSTSSDPQLTRLFPIALLVFLLVYNLNESALLTRSGMPFMLWVAVGSSIGLRGQQSRRDHPARSGSPLLYNSPPFVGYR